MAVAEDFARRMFESTLSLKRDETADEERRTENVNFAVSLHNRIRNIPSSARAEVFKAYIKAVVAKYLVLYCSSENTVKAMSKSILLLARAGMDLMHLPGAPETTRSDAILCLKEVARMWADIPETALLKVISPLETDNLRIAVYQTEICLAESLASNITDALVHIRAASNLVRSMQAEVKLELSKRCTTIAFKSTSKENKDIQMVAEVLRHAMTSVEWIKSDDTGDNLLRGVVMKQKAVVMIAMLRTFRELTDFENCLSCSQLLEKHMIEWKASSPHDEDMTNIESQYLYYKLRLLITRGDTQEAEQVIRQRLIKLDAHQVILQGLIEFTNATSIVHHDIFQTVMRKFPEDHFLSTQLAYLRCMILHDSTTDEGYHRTLNVSGHIIDNHMDRSHVLDEESHTSLRAMMLERIKYFHSQGHFSKSHDWVILLEKLVTHAEDRECLATTLLLKAETLYCLEKYSGAVQVVEKLIQRELSTRALVMLFKATLAVSGATSAVSLIRSKIAAFPNTSENLDRWELCIGVAEEAEDMEAVDMLYAEYIQTYCSYRGWELGNETTLAEILCDLSSGFQKRFIREEYAPSTEISERPTKLPRLEGAGDDKESLAANKSTFITPAVAKRFVMACDVAVVRKCLLPPAESLLALLERDDLDLSALGSRQDFTWYSTFLGNTAVHLANAGNDDNHERQERLATAARLLELSSIVSERLVSSSEDPHRVYTSLIVASALRLDASTSSDDNLAQAIINLDRAFHMLRRSNAMEGPLYRLALVLDFGAKLRLDRSEADKFISSRKTELLGLAAQELIFFASLCMREPNGTVLQAEEFLRLALQQCN